MSLYKLNENCSEEAILDSILNEGYFEDFDEPTNHYLRLLLRKNIND